MATLQVRLDDQLRTRAQDVAAHMGLDLSSAIRLFLTQMVTENGLPFKPFADKFYSVKNQDAIKKSIAQLNAGQTLTKSLEELDAISDENYI